MFVTPRQGFNVCQRCCRNIMSAQRTLGAVVHRAVKISPQSACLRTSAASASPRSAYAYNQPICQPSSKSRNRWSKFREVRTFSVLACRMAKESTADMKLKIDENPYFDKYQKKLDEMKRSAPDTYRQKVVEIEDEMRKDREFLQEQIKKAEAEAEVKSEEKTFPPESLDSIMRTELVRDKTAEEIEEIWKEYHSKKDCIYAVMKSIDYDDMQQKANVCPSFLYPLPRKTGFEFFFCKISGKVVVFTPLVMYQRLKENAMPCLTLAHFTEFKDNKDIVLMTGPYDNKVITRSEALNLVRQMSTYYSRRAAERFNLVRIFNHTPEKFNAFDVIHEYQEMTKFLESEN